MQLPISAEILPWVASEKEQEAASENTSQSSNDSDCHANRL